MTGLLTRSYNVDYSKADKNWHTWEYSKKHGLLHPTIHFTGDFYYLRKNEYPYDGRKEQWLILHDGKPQSIDLLDLIKELNEQGYTVIFNSTDRKSAKGLRHGHALK